MKNMKLNLLLLLVLQVVIVAVSTLLPNASQQQAGAELLTLVPEQVDRLVLVDDKQQLELHKDASGWHLPDTQNLPANSDKVSALLSQLAQLKTRWPVATSNSSQRRFEVADDKFQRHVMLYQGSKELGNFYLGTSPGFRQSHVRRQGEQDIFAVALNGYQLPVSSDDWLDKNLLRVKDVSAVNAAQLQLHKAGDSWQQALPAMDAGAAALDQDKVQSYANRWQALSVLKPVSKVLDKPDSTVSVTGSAGEYQFQLQHQGEDYLIKRNDIDAVFAISADSYNALTQAKADDLMAKQDKAEQSVPSPAPQAGAETEVN